METYSSNPVPRMTPILRNRHEKVQEASINLIGRIGKSPRSIGIPDLMFVSFQLSRSWRRIRTGARVDANLFRIT